MIDDNDNFFAGQALRLYRLNSSACLVSPLSGMRADHYGKAGDSGHVNPYSYLPPLSQPGIVRGRFPVPPLLSGSYTAAGGCGAPPQ
jgi:hypothetical protein